MKNFKPRTYTQKIQLRIKMSYFLLVLMLIYMVVMGELGGDSRVMTGLANTISDFIFSAESFTLPQELSIIKNCSKTNYF